jgi:uncharacterized repeat protein (TIGR03803 family)
MYGFDSSGNFSTLQNFSNGGPTSPEASLMQGSNGLLYGTTSSGADYFLNGTYDGTVFAADFSGNISVIHSFNWNTDGYEPIAAVLQDSSQNLVGTTISGGQFSGGVLYKIDPTGAYSVLHEFGDPTNPNDSGNPQGGVILGPDGAYYGVGADPYPNHTPGGVYRVDASGNYSALHLFVNNGVDGDSPSGSLVLGPDGKFYGVTGAGGAFGQGIIFRVDTQGNEEILHTFDGFGGSEPIGGLLYASDGYFYGTTFSGGKNNDGVIYRIDDQGNFTVLHSFTGTDGSGPTAPLIEGSDHLLYGTADYGGLGNGTVFKFDPNGVIQIPTTQIQSLTIDPSTVNIGDFATATVVLSAPAGNGPDLSGNPGSGGEYIQLNSDISWATTYAQGGANPGAISTQSTPNGTSTYLFVPQGQSTVTFQVGLNYAASQTTANISTSLNGSSASAPLTVNPNGVASLTLDPSTVDNGGVSTATLTLNFTEGNATSGELVELDTDQPAATTIQYGGPNPSAVFQATWLPNMPMMIWVPSGQNSVTFQVVAGTVAAQTTANITASLAGSSQSAQLTIGSAASLGITLAPSTVSAFGTSNGTVTLAAPAAPGGLDPYGNPSNGQWVQLSSDQPSISFQQDATNPQMTQIWNGTGYQYYIFIPEGQTTVTFLVDTQNVTAKTVANISASLNGSTASTPLTINPNQVAGVTLDPTTVNAFGSSLATLTLDSPAAPGGLDPYGNPSSGEWVQLSSDQASIWFQQDWSNPTQMMQIWDGSAYQYYIFVQQFQTSVTFQVYTPNVTTQTVANISASLNGSTQSAPLTINPDQIASLTLNPTTVYAYGTSIGTLTLNTPAAPGGLDPYGNPSNGQWVQLSSDQASMWFQQDSTSPIPAQLMQIWNGTEYQFYILVPEFQTTVTFQIDTQNVTTQTVANISAALNGSTQSAPLTIKPNDTTAPTTTADIEGAPVGPVTIALSATDPDNDPSTLTTYYALDGGAQQTYSGTITVNAYGNHVISYFSVDPAGNTEAANTGTFAINYPIPAISTISPGSIRPTSTPVVLTIDGSGFSPATVVQFGTEALTPKSVTPTEITVTLPGADLAKPHGFDLTVSNPAPGGGISNDVTFVVKGYAYGNSAGSQIKTK